MEWSQEVVMVGGVAAITFAWNGPNRHHWRDCRNCIELHQHKLCIGIKVQPWLWPTLKKKKKNKLTLTPLTKSLYWSGLTLCGWQHPQTSLDEVQPLYQYLFCVVRNTYWRSWSWLGFVLETFGCVLCLAAVMFILSQAWWRWPFYNVFALIKEVVLILGRCCVMLGNYLCKCYTQLVNNSSPHHMVCGSSTIRPTCI